MRFEYPFIYLGNFGIKYFSIVVFILILITFVFFYKKKIYRLKWSFKKLNLVKVLLPYLLLIPFYWWNYLYINQFEFLTNMCRWVLSAELFFIVIICIALGCTILYSNKETYLNLLLFPISIIFYIDMLSVIVTKQVDLSRWYNIVSFIVLGLFIVIVNNIWVENLEKTKKDENDGDISYSPIENFNDLYEQRKWQAEHLKNIIDDYSNSESLSICISGEWGDGKTSFVNAVLGIIRLTHKVIRINALDIDSLESLLKYLFERIKCILKEENYYVGISSEYQDFLSSALEIVSHGKIKSNTFKNFFGSEKDYRKTKKYLENTLKNMLGKDKLIIVVDDIERCSTEKAIMYINFIKEIATFKNCIEIFMVDYEQLKKSFEKEKETPIKYLDKFFNRRIDLVKVDYNFIIKHYINKNEYDFNLYADFKICVLDEINALIIELQKQIEKLENVLQKQSNKDISQIKESYTEQIDWLKMQIQSLNDNLNNSRNVTKLLVYIKEFCRSVNYELTKRDKRDEIEQYLYRTEARKNVIVLSLMRTIMQENYYKIQRFGFNNYVRYLCDENLKKDNYDRLLKSLMAGVWYEDYYLFSSPNNYKQIEVGRFMTALVENPSELSKVVNGFSSKDDKYITFLDKKQFLEIDIDYLELFNIVVRNYAFKDEEIGCKLIENLFLEVSKDFDGKELKSDVAFQIFHSNYSFERLFSPKLKIMEQFYKIFCAKNIIIVDTFEEKKQLQLFCRNYVPESLNNLTKILYYHCIDYGDSVDIVKGAREKAWLGTSLDAILGVFIKELEGHFKTREGSTVEKLIGYLNECKQELSELSFEEIEDVRNDLNMAFSQMQEYEYLNKIIEYVNTQQATTDCINLKDVKFEEIPNIINLFIKEFKNNTSASFKTQSYQSIEQFFYIIQDISKQKQFNDELMRKLNMLITEFKDFTKTDVFRYRKIMFDIQRKNNYTKC